MHSPPDYKLREDINMEANKKSFGQIVSNFSMPILLGLLIKEVSAYREQVV